MEDYTDHDAPPAYVGESIAPEHQFKIRNARFHSAFTTTGQPGVSDYREHLECMKDAFLDSTRGIGSAAGPSSEPQSLNVEYSQAFSDVAHLICEYQACLLKIKPLHEEDVLLLLLSQYARSTGAGVYLEIKRPGDLQVYDSEIPEPLHTAGIQDHLVYGSGVLNARFPVDSPRSMSPSITALDSTQHVRYMPIPQSPTAMVRSSVTVNFPGMELVSLPHALPTSVNMETPPEYSTSLQEDTSNSTWGVLPRKLQPPQFHVHQCHHPGVEYGGEDDAFELPIGFPEAIQYICEIPDCFNHVAFHVGDRSRLSHPIVESSMQSFECYVTPLDTQVYITVERTGDGLAYNCFRDEEVWAACHDNHVECQDNARE